MIKVGSLVKYIDNVQIGKKPNLRAIGIVTKIEKHELEWMSNPYATLDILVQNAGCGISLIEKGFGCGLHSLSEVDESETILAILSGRVK